MSDLAFVLPRICMSFLQGSKIILATKYFTNLKSLHLLTSKKTMIMFSAPGFSHILKCWMSEMLSVVFLNDLGFYCIRFSISAINQGPGVQQSILGGFCRSLEVAFVSGVLHICCVMCIFLWSATATS